MDSVVSFLYVLEIFGLGKLLPNLVMIVHVGVSFFLEDRVWIFYGYN